MSENKIKSRKSVHSRNRAQSNVVVRKKSLFELIAPLPKTVGAAFSYDNQTNNDTLISSLILFLKTYHPKELSKLKFYPDYDGYQDLMFRLIYLCLELHYTIQVPTGEYPMDFDARFKKSVEDHCESARIIDYSDVFAIQNEGIRIGYTYFVYKFAKDGFNNIMDQDLSNEGCYSMYAMEFEMAFQQKEEDPDCDDPQEYLDRLIKLQKTYRRYLCKPYEKFLKCRPRCPHEKKLKAHLLTMMGIDYSIIRMFPENLDGEEEEYMSFADWFFVAGNHQMNEIEEWYVRSMDDYSQEGVSVPAYAYTVKNGELHVEVTPEEVEKFKVAVNSLDDMWTDYLKPVYDEYKKRRMRADAIRDRGLRQSNEVSPVQS